MPSAARRRRTVQEDEDGSEEEERRQSTQRGRSRAPASDDESEEEAEDSAEDDEEGEVAGGDQLVKKLVRYALACEYQRVSIKRTGISEKVIGKQRGAYKRMFKAAQEELRNKFGMEMVELPRQEKVTMKEKRDAQKRKGNSKPTLNYIVKSILPAEYRIPEIMPPSIVGSQEDEAIYTGLCSLIVALIALSPNSQVPDHKLTSYLKRMNIDENTPLDKTALTLKKMTAQGYIYKSVDKSADEETTDWLLGPRGKVEIGNKGIHGLVHEVYGDDAPEDLDKRIMRSLGMEPVSAMGKEGQDANADESMVNGDDNGDGDPGPSRGRGRR